MLPWGHFAVGYLLYTVGTRVWHGRVPADAPTLALAVGTQFPDLVDKPLNWGFGVFDGRGIGHSLLGLAVLCGLVFYAARRDGRTELAGAFSLGAFTHLLGDAWAPLLNGNVDRASFLLWPLRPAPTYPKDGLFDHLDVWVAQMRALPHLSPVDLVTSGFWFQFVLFALLTCIWALDGCPGVRTTWQLVSRLRVGAQAGDQPR